MVFSGWKKHNNLIKKIDEISTSSFTRSPAGEQTPLEKSHWCSLYENYNISRHHCKNKRLCTCFSYFIVVLFLTYSYYSYCNIALESTCSNF